MLYMYFLYTCSTFADFFRYELMIININCIFFSTFGCSSSCLQPELTCISEPSASGEHCHSIQQLQCVFRSLALQQ